MKESKGARRKADFFGLSAALGPLVLSAMSLPLEPHSGWGFGHAGLLLPRLARMLPLPLGSEATRSLLLRPLLAALLGYVIYRAVRALAIRQGGRSALDGWLALSAAWLVGFSHPALVTLYSEGLSYCVATGVVCVLAYVLGRRRFDVYFGALSAGLVLLGTGLPLALLRGNIDGYFRAPLVHGELGLSFLLRQNPVLGLFAAITLAFAALAFPRSRVKQGVFPFVALCALAFLGVSSGDASGRATLELCAITSLAVLAALGLRAVAEGALAMEFFGARALATLLTILSFALGLGEMDRSLSTEANADTKLARDFGDALLEGIPDGSLVLVRDPALHAALLTLTRRGERPDLLVLSEHDLQNPGALVRILTREPELLSLVRELNVTREPSEEALCHLADTRPVFVEPNVAWPAALLSHLSPRLFLSRFEAHPVSRSDRVALVEAAKERAKPLLGRLDRPSPTASLALRLQLIQSVALRGAGDTASADGVLQAFFPVPATPEAPADKPPAAAAQVAMGTR